MLKAGKIYFTAFVSISNIEESVLFVKIQPRSADFKQPESTDLIENCTVYDQTFILSNRGHILNPRHFHLSCVSLQEGSCFCGSVLFLELRNLLVCAILSHLLEDVTSI